MNIILTYFLKIFIALTTTIVLIITSLLHGNLPSSKSLETLWQGTQPPKITIQIQDSNSSSNSKFQIPVGLGSIELIAKNLSSLPTMETTTSLSQTIATNVYIKSGDNAVNATRLAKASQIIKDISLPTLNAVVGLSPAKNIQVVLFSSPKTYANALAQANIDPNSIKSIVANTGGLTVNTTIWIPLYNLEDNSDLANALSHELFHACASSQGYGNQLPIWLNEGTAWRVGLTAMQKVNPQKTSLEMAFLEANVRNAAKNGILLPLNASENDILNAQYNVEYEDYMAVEQLVKHYNTSTYKSFIHNLESESISTDFQNSFNTSIDKFQNSFIKTL